MVWRRHLVPPHFHGSNQIFTNALDPGLVGNWTVEWPDSPLRAQNYEKSSVDLDNIVLSRWLAKNCAEAEQRFQACRPIREEIGRLQV